MTDFYMAKTSGNPAGIPDGNDSTGAPNDPSKPYATLDAIIKATNDIDVDGDNIYFYQGTYTEAELVTDGDDSGTGSASTNVIIKIHSSGLRQHSLIAYQGQAVTFTTSDSNSTNYQTFLEMHNLSDTNSGSAPTAVIIDGITFAHNDSSSGTISLCFIKGIEDQADPTTKNILTIRNCTFLATKNLSVGCLFIEHGNGFEMPIVVDNCTFTLTGEADEAAFVARSIMNDVTFTNNTITVTNTSADDAGDPIVELKAENTASGIDKGGDVVVANNTFDITAGTNANAREAVEVVECKNITVSNNKIAYKNHNITGNVTQCRVIYINTNSNNDNTTPKTHTITISGNDIFMDEWIGHGIRIQQSSSSHTIVPELTSVKINNNTITGTPTLGIASSVCTGIYAYSTNGLVIENNNIKNTVEGIFVRDSASAILKHNKIENCGDTAGNDYDAPCIYVRGSLGAKINDNILINDFVRNRGTFLYIHSSAGFELSRNRIHAIQPNAAHPIDSAGWDILDVTSGQGFGGQASGATSTAQDNIYYNTAVTANDNKTDFHISTVGDFTAAQWLSKEPTAIINPSVTKQFLTSSVKKQFLTKTLS